METSSSLDLMFSMRVGFSKDIHKITEGKPLILCGVNIPSSFGLESHSDGDCAIHAIVEAIFGAMNVGDLGAHYPPNDDKYKNISSTYFLEDAKKIMDEEGYTIGNIDLFISCEKPKLKDYIYPMRQKVSELLGTDIKNVSIKAGTNEKMDAVGKGEAIEAYCVCLLKEKNDGR